MSGPNPSHISISPAENGWTVHHKGKTFIAKDPLSAFLRSLTLMMDSGTNEIGALEEVLALNKELLNKKFKILEIKTRK